VQTPWPVAKTARGAAVVCSELLTFRACRYSSFWPNSLPVFRSRKWNLVQAGQLIPAYSFSGMSSSSSSQCWTFIEVSGQVKMKAAIGLDTASTLVVFDLDQHYG
jgi:hypothetical protein